jgi:predicted peptidase
MIRKIFLTIIITGLFSVVFSQDFCQFQNRTHSNKKGETISYRILFPKNYNPSKKYPLVMFLHGAGERGTDNQKQLTHGASLFLDSLQQANFPAFVIFPQCPEGKTWAPMRFEEETNERIFEYQSKALKQSELAKEILDYYLKNEAVDKNKIYIMGLSMGAMGTFDMTLRYPKCFAAAIAICGGADNDKIKRIKKLPIRIYHGKEDDVVSVEHSRMAFYSLKAVGGNVEYKEYPNVRHDSWLNAFEEPDFLTWLFEQKKK